MTTNNNVEGFHNGFVSLVGYLNPTIWDWLNAVRAKQTLSANDIARQLEDLCSMSNIMHNNVQTVLQSSMCFSTLVISV